MPVTWKIRNPMVVINIDGPGDEDIRPAMVAAIRSQEFRQGMSLLFDVRRAQNNPAAEDLRSLARWVSKLPSRGTSRYCAIVVGPRRHHFGLARMVATYAELEGMNVEVFTDVEAAELWLIKSGGEEKHLTA